MPPVATVLARLGNRICAVIADPVFVSITTDWPLSGNAAGTVNPLNSALWFTPIDVTTVADKMFPVTETFPVKPDDAAVGLHVKVNSVVFHIHLNGGESIACITKFAEVLAGSKALPTPLGRLKLKRLQNSIVPKIVFVEIAIEFPLSFDKFSQH
jgi:hypothetical protein